MMAMQKLFLSLLRVPDKTEVPTDPRRVIKAGVFVMLALVLAIAAWTIWIPMDGAVIAQGLVRTEQSVWAIQPSVNGIVQRITAQDGQQVKAGQVLVEIADPERLSTLQATRALLENELARNARLLAEASLAPVIQFPGSLIEKAPSSPGITKLMDSENRIFQLRRATLEKMGETLRKQENLLGAERESLSARVASQRHSSKLIGEQIDTVQRLVDKGFFSPYRIQDLERTRAQDNAAIGELAADTLRAEQRANEVRFKQTEILNNYIETANQELRRSSERITQLQEQLNALTERVSSQTITAPGDGIVMNLKTTTTGLVVSSGQTILEIVPDAPEVIIEGLVRSRDIRFVRQEMPVEVAISGWNQRSAPLLRGLIKYVAGDIARTTDKDGAMHYLIRVHLAPDSIPRNDPSMPLKPGMQATVYIKTGERTLLDYIAEPVIDSMRSSFKEP